jgi:hypothetical protein
VRARQVFTRLFLTTAMRSAQAFVLLDSLFDLWEDEIPPVLSVNIGQSGYLRS